MRVGSDPEVFLMDVTGKPISSIGYINHDKWNPMQIPDMAEGYTLQEDNVSLEYGIPPAASAEELKRSINAVMAKSLEYLPNLQFSKLSCIIFPEDQMVHPAAHIFGCEPDFNAWTGDVNKKPRPPHQFMRSAGGHVHIETQKDPFDVARNCDLILGVAAVFMDDSPEAQQRKSLYGKAGACRVKSYGVEYRVLSNFWIFEDKYIDWVFRGVTRAEQMAGTWDVKEHADAIIEAINNNNKQVAESLINHFNLEVV